MSELLPPNRTPLEAALEAAGADRFPLPTDLVASVWSPETCPVHLLPYLAWALSVDLWDERWSETTKREVCRKSLALHRLKTTPAGIKAHVEVAGAKVLKVIRPPQRAHRRGVMTDAQRKAWLDDLPQVRVYPFYKRGVAVRRHFYTGPGVRNQWRGVADLSEGETPASPDFMRSSRGFSLYSRKATFYDRGVELDVTLGATDLLADRVYLRRKAPRRMFYGQGFRVGYLRTSAAETNVITLNMSADHEMRAVTPGMTPVDVRPQRISQGRIAPTSRRFYGRFGGFMRTSHAPLLIYDRVALLDPERLGALRKVRSYHGHGRYGIDPYTAELTIRVPMNRARRRSGRWHKSGFRKAADMAALNKAIEAVRVSKAFRDTVHIDTATYGRVTFESGLRFGEFLFGQIREAV